MTDTPLSLTLSPKLDLALAKGWQAWDAMARELGAKRVTSWLAQRTDGEIPRDDLFDAITSVIETDDANDLAVARAELGELLEEVDDELADALWEAVLVFGYDSDDPDLIFEATVHLAGIAEDLGDPLAAAEYFIDYLNWRRQDDHVSDAEGVLTAFDEIIRLAESDGAPKSAALYTFRQVAFAKLVDGEDDQVTTGDWERNADPYEAWS